jgi:hypothetical protein
MAENREMSMILCKCGGEKWKVSTPAGGDQTEISLICCECLNILQMHIFEAPLAIGQAKGIVDQGHKGDSFRIRTADTN